MLIRSKTFYGWWIVLASALLHFLGGGIFYYGFTVFFNPIRQTFGWTATVTSVAFALQRLEAGILGPVAGFLVDKLGPRKLMLFGWSTVGLGFILMSRINSLGAFYASFIMVAIGMSFASGLVTNTAIANWFDRKRSRAMAFTYIGPGVSGILVPLIAFSISQFGWRQTLVATAIGLWIICLPLSLLVRHKPGQYGYLPDGETTTALNAPAAVTTHLPAELVKPASSSATIDFTARAALRTPAFWLLAAVSFFQQIATSAVTVHIVPYLESAGVSTAVAATAVTGMTLCSLIGRIGFGLLGDTKNKRYLISIALFLQTLGILIFSLIDIGRTWFIVLFLLIFGPGYGAPIPLRPALQADYFGTIMGLMWTISMIGGLASPVVAGWIFDVTGSYQLAWQIFALATAPAIPLMLLAKPPRAKPEP